MTAPRNFVSDVDILIERWRKTAGSSWREIFRFRMSVHRRAYECSGNPLDAWEALILARALDESPENWIMDYLAGRAVKLHDLANFAATGGGKPDHSAIARIFGFGSSKTFPGGDDWDWIAMAVQVRDQIAAGDQETYAIETVANINECSQSTVRRAWKRLQKESPEIAQWS